MSVYTKLELIQHWTPSEKQFVDYILKNPESVKEKTSSQLAKQASTSLSTIYRVCEKLGLGGFNELRYLLLKDLDQRITIVEDVNIPFKKDSTDYEVIQAMKQVWRQTIEETIEHLDLNTLRLVVNRMENAETINIYTSKLYRGSAEMFRYNMGFIDKKVNILTEVLDQELGALASDEKTMSIVISYAGRNKELPRIIRYLSRKKRDILLLSSLRDGEFIKYCTYHILLSSREETNNKKIGSFSSGISPTFVFDLLYSLLFKRHYESNLQNFDEKALWDIDG